MSTTTKQTRVKQAIQAIRAFLRNPHGEGGKTHAADTPARNLPLRMKHWDRAAAREFAPWLGDPFPNYPDELALVFAKRRFV
jgi:hypothetical protein